MENTRTNNVVRNIIFAGINGVIGTLLPFAVRTCTIRYLGSEYMGLNNLCSSILTVLSATDLGVANAFAFRLYQPVAEHDKAKVCSLLNFYKKVYFVVGMAILSIGLMILPFFKCFISQNMPQGVNVYFIFFLYLINAVISYTIFAYKNIIFAADQRKDYESITTSVTFGLLYISQIFLIAAGRYQISVCMLPLCTLLGNISRNLIACCKYPDYFPKGTISKDVKEALKNDILSVAVYKFRDISRNAFDSIVISAYQGLIILSDYQNYYMILSVPVWLLTILYASILPSVGNLAVSGSREEMYGIYKKTAFILSFLSAWAAVCYGCLIQDFVGLWLGAEYRLSETAVILFAVYIYLHGEIMVIKIMRESIGLWNQGRIWAVLEMAANLVLNVLLARWIGVEGVILATIITIVCISIPAENRILFRWYFTGKGTEKLKGLLVNAAWAAGTALAAGFCCCFAPWGRCVGFVCKVCICVCLPPVSCAVCFHRTDEFRFLKNLIKGF